MTSHQIRLLLGTDARAEQAYHALGGGQIAGGLQHQHPFPLLMENVQLFKVAIWSTPALVRSRKLTPVHPARHMATQ